MFRQRNFIVKQLSVFNVSYTATTVFKNRGYIRRLHLGVSYLNNISKNSSTNISKYVKDDKLNFRVLSDIYKSINFENITTDEGHLLLQCCGTITFNSSQRERNKICQSIYGNLTKHNKLDTKIQNSYIQICTENKTLLNCKTFLENLQSEPNFQTYSLLFKNVCECGDVNQAFLLLEIMKKNHIAADEDIFNNLVLVHTLKGGIEAAETVLGTMKAAQVLETSQTYFSILKGIIMSKNRMDFKKFLEKYSITIDENQLLTILKELGLNMITNWLPEMKPLFADVVMSREFINNLKNICIYLVHMDRSNSAIEIFHYLQQDSEEYYGFFILEEMLHCKVHTDDIISSAKYFCDDQNHEYLFEKLTEVALKHEYFDVAWKLFEHMKVLRPHFFWPLFLRAKDTNGEAGVFQVLEQMNKLQVTLDVDTLEHYIIPFSSHDDIILLVDKLKNLGLTVKFVLAPLIRVLLKQNKVEKASEACQHYDVKIGGDKLFHLICTAWISTKNPAIITVLQKFCEHASVENDLAGDFLVSSMQSCTTVKHYQEFLKVLKAIQDANLKITTTSADILRGLIAEELEERDKDLSESILDGIDKILEFKLKTEKDHILHPRDMSVDELECHLVELTEKGMETRGLIRRLIYSHVKLGNINRVNELRDLFLQSGYEETLGMKSSLMYNFIKSGNIESALDLFNDIRTNNPEFVIDHYKIIDLATLMVQKNRISETMGILKENESSYSKVGGNPATIQRNCVQLLNAFQDENEQKNMFNFLVSKRLCKINNIMVGPLVRIFLARGDLQKATDTFVELAEKYKFTPLQYELIKEIAQSQNEELLQRVLDVSTNIHGPVSTQVSLIGVLAEIGEEKILTKLFASTKMPIQQELKKRCDRWVKERKVDALFTLANSSNRLPKELVDVNYIYQCIIKVFAVNNDCAAAVKFYEHLLEKDIAVDRRLENQLYNFFKQNNYSMPTSLRIHSKV